VKPTSGGGIYTSIQGAKLCAQVAVAALRQEDTSTRFLSRYHLLWMRQFGKSLLQGLALRRLLTGLTPREIDSFLQLFQASEFQRVAQMAGDIDFPARLFSRLVSPGLVLQACRLVPLSLWPRLAWLALQWRLAGVRQALSPLFPGSIPSV
jgi:flavin-dependent dehydrogenase